MTAVHNSWWNALVGDSNPDLYIKITDSNGNLLYVSDYKEDCGLDTQFPVTFRLSSMVKVPTNGGYKLEIWDEDVGDDTKGSSITLSSNAEGTYTWGNSSSNTEGYCIISLWHPALDIQWGLEKTWDFYYSTFNHQGFDGNNALTRAMLHSPMSASNIAAEKSHSIFNASAMEPNNAFAHNEDNVSGAFLYFGMGNEKGESLVDLNCITHEFTHLVTAYRPKGKLVYQGESGAINEGYSDAMAVAAEARLTGSANWLYGHGVQQLGLTSSNMGIIYNYCRNLSNPKEGGPEGPKPDTYGGQNWYDPTNTSAQNDNGGVHMNNSIFTHWFYILCEGKKGVNDNQQSYSVSPIGMEKALKIIWRMHRTYLPAQATYSQARQYAIQSVKDLYPSDENAIKCVTDAWYAVGVGSKYIAPNNPITVKAKIPSSWSNVVSAWTWGPGSEGYWATLVNDGDWYSFTSNVSPVNIVYVNGATWSTNPNQTVDIALNESSCIEINSNGTNKCTYTVVDCDPGDFLLNPGKYVVVANRDKDGDRNWYYMTSDLGTASTKRFQAVSTGVESIDAVAVSNLEEKYIWTLEADGANWKLKNGTQYVTWTSGNSANLSSTAKTLTFDVNENQVQAHFNDGTAERYLSLNAGTNNNYFAFYGNTNQITHLYFLPYDDGTTPPPPTRECKTVPYTETFASSQGDFTIYNLTLPSGFSSIWNWDSQYGMVAKCIKGSTKYKSESWLVSPCIELPTNESCTVSFSHAAKFFESTSQMSMWISTNFDESDLDNVKWVRLDIPNYPTGANWNWYESGDIDLSAYKGQYVNIAFCYKSNTSYAPQWEIKNFAVKKTTPTNVENINIQQPFATKILRDGQIFILRGDKTYTLQGQEVK